MLPLARVWTWIGQTFVPIALAWMIYVRNGLPAIPDKPGVIVSRAYLGLLISLFAGALLSWVYGLYVIQAKRGPREPLIPPNTTFEELNSRSLPISWLTSICFAIVTALAVITFSTIYSDSEIAQWESASPLPGGFWGSRQSAFAAGCAHQPCYAMSPRLNNDHTPIYGVAEYILYVTDGVLIVGSLALLSGLIFSASAVIRKRSL